MSNGEDRTALATAVTEAVLNSPGSTEPALRGAIKDRAKSRVSGGDASGDLPEAVASFVDAMATDPRSADVQGLIDAGNSEDATLELVLSAAIGLGEARLEHGLRALKEAGS